MSVNEGGYLRMYREIKKLKSQMKIEITIEDRYYAASELLKILRDES